jgi:NAD(P)-dependent dehydrogenase (short-subunit alcohol dehydrogenase family)
MNAKQQIEQDLDGKVAIVTGAASGIGLATALLLEARGASVIAEDVNPEVNKLSGRHARIVPFIGDVATEEAAKQVVALAVERFGKLDILVNNAATIIYKRAEDMTLEEWNRILSVNLTGVFLHSREAVRAMIPKKTGAIVNIGSYACYFGFPSIAAYCASKGGLAQLTRVLAVENIQHGIRVNAVGAGDVVTNLLTGVNFWCSTARTLPSDALRSRKKSPRWWHSSHRTRRASWSAQSSWQTAGTACRSVRP